MLSISLFVSAMAAFILEALLIIKCHALAVHIADAIARSLVLPGS